MKRLPIKAAKDISKQYEQDQVIVLTLDKKDNLIHIVTYGKTIEDCEKASTCGNKLKREFLKWPEHLCNDIPNRLKRKNNG